MSTPPFYRAVLTVVAPIVRRWGRLQVIGGDLLPATGPCLVVSNHDSYWDPLVVGVAALRRRQIRALAKSSLWRFKALAFVLDGMGQLRITRGRADRGELTAVLDSLAAGECVGIFPEGGISLGRPRRAYSGAGWLARQRPDALVLAVAITGAVDIARFPKRPQVKVEFFEPTSLPDRPAGSPIAMSSIGVSRRLMAEVRRHAPEAASGRRRSHRDQANVSSPSSSGPKYA